MNNQTGLLLSDTAEQLSFDYQDAELTSEQASRLRDIEVAISTRWSALKEIYDMTLTEIGKYMLDAKSTAPHVFMRWRQTCFPRMSDDLCETYMNAARRLVDDQGTALPGVDYLEGRALRAAASPSTPQQAREAILSKAVELSGNPSPHYAEIVTHAPEYLRSMTAARLLSEPDAAKVSQRLRHKDTPAPVREFAIRHEVRDSYVVVELARAYIEEGQGKTRRYTDVREDGALNYMNGDRVLIGEATESQWNKWMVERRAVHIEDSNLERYDWYAEQQGKLRYIAGQVVFIFQSPDSALVKAAKGRRKGKVRMGLKVGE